jgi:3-oxoacyl-[acyl-carrier protein] reductase
VAHGSHAREVWTRAGMTLDQVLENAGVDGALLQRSPTLAEVAETAAFLASDRGSGMTATIANISCGSVLDFWPGAPARASPLAQRRPHR